MSAAIRPRWADLPKFGSRVLYDGREMVVMGADAEGMLLIADAAVVDPTLDELFSGAWPHQSTERRRRRRMDMMERIREIDDLIQGRKPEKPKRLEPHEIAALQRMIDAAKEHGPESEEYREARDSALAMFPILLNYPTLSERIT